VITISATGANPTTGYKSYFLINPSLIDPPIFEFINIKPTGIAGDVILPFHVSIFYKGDAEKITVHDLNGSHAIPVVEGETLAPTPPDSGSLNASTDKAPIPGPETPFPFANVENLTPEQKDGLEGLLGALRRPIPSLVSQLVGWRLRVIHPGDLISMDFLSNRVNINVDADGVITSISYH
jgi:hypothetical protein